MAKKLRVLRGKITKDDKVQDDAKTNLDNYSAEPLFLDFNEGVLAIMIYLSSVGIYIYTMYPGLPGGDSGELITVAKEFGVGHPPGYPTFTILAALMINLFPFGTTAWKTNLLSTLIAGFANVVMYLNVKRFTGSDGVGVLTAGWCGFSRIFWMWSIQGEVFSLSNFFAASIMYVTWRFANAEGRAGKYYEAKLGAVICGLALTNQHTSVLYIFPTSLWVLYTLWKYNLTKVDYLFKVGTHGLLGLAPYLQLPISSFFFNARVTWGDHRQLSNFKSHLLREDYGTFQLIKSDDQSTFLDNFFVYFTDSSRELTIIVWVLFIMAMVVVARRGTPKQKEVFTIYMLMFSTYHLVFCSLANIRNPEGLYHGVLERFWLQPSLALCAMSGCGLGILVAHLIIPHQRFIFLAVAVLITSFQVQRNYYDCNENDNFFFYHISRSILTHVPQRSIILTRGDFSANTFRYHTIGEDYRTDVKVISTEHLKTSWFYDLLKPVSFPDVEFPPWRVYQPSGGQQNAFYNLKQFLDLNIDKSAGVYVCVDIPEDDDSIEGHYEAWPFGICRKFVKLNSTSKPDPLEYLKTIPLWDVETTPVPDILRYEPESWEYTLLQSVIKSYAKTGTFLWEQANKLPGINGTLKYEYYSKAAELLLNNRRYLEENMARGVISDGTQKVLYIFDKYIGHISLILYAKTDDPEVKKHHERNCIKFWTFCTEPYNSEELKRDDMTDLITAIVKQGHVRNVAVKG